MDIAPPARPVPPAEIRELGTQGLLRDFGTTVGVTAEEGDAFLEAASRKAFAEVVADTRRAATPDPVTRICPARQLVEVLPRWRARGRSAEYAHVLGEALGHLDRDPGKVVAPMATAMVEALSIRAANYTADDIPMEGGDLMLKPWRLRARYALRFGAQSLEDQLSSSGRARCAPRITRPSGRSRWRRRRSVRRDWTFIRTATRSSTGTCLPIPVDLEQREGWVHRYKGHAIRKNVARAHRADGYRRAAGDPWEAMFVAARRARPKGVNDLVPFWVYQVEGGARIERYVPAFPLSREVEKLRLLKRSLAAYRLVFGQYRQEDLAQFVVQAREDGQLAATMDLLMLDLSPR